VKKQVCNNSETWLTLSGVIFITLPPIPSDGAETQYLKELDILTQDLPPTMLVFNPDMNSVIATEF
jgi:hypothetical protein